MKTCSKCGETKANSGFYRNYTKPDGLHTACRVCMSAYYGPRQKAKRAKQRATERSAIMRRRAHPLDGNHLDDEARCAWENARQEALRPPPLPWEMPEPAAEAAE